MGRRVLLMGGLAAAFGPQPASACEPVLITCEGWRKRLARFPAIVLVRIEALQGDYDIWTPVRGRVVRALKGRVPAGAEFRFEVENNDATCEWEGLPAKGEEFVLCLKRARNGWRVEEVDSRASFESKCGPGESLTSL